MHDVKVFLSKRYHIPELEKTLLKHKIELHRKNSECDTAFVLQGAYTNPLIFKGKKVLGYFSDNEKHIWNTSFDAFYKPILEYYYDEFIDLNYFKTFAAMADTIAKEVKRLENETD